MRYNQLALGLYIKEIKVQREELLSKIRDRLQRVHGDRLRGVVLFGSAARGDLSDDSDVDLLVLLQGPVHFGQDLQTNISALYPLTLETGHPISAKPVDAKRYDEFECPLFRNAKTEGIRI